MPLPPTDSIQDRATSDLQAILQALNLTTPAGLPGNPVVGNIGNNVFVQMFPEETNLIYPCILVTCEDTIEEVDTEVANFNANAVIYPINVLICDRVSERYRLARPVYELWRYIVCQTLKGLPTAAAPILPNTPECWDIRLRLLKNLDQKKPQYQFVVSGIVALLRTVTPLWRGGQNP